MIRDSFQIIKYLAGLLLALIVLPTKWLISETDMNKMNPENGVKDGVSFLNEMKTAFNEVDNIQVAK